MGGNTQKKQTFYNNNIERVETSKSKTATLFGLLLILVFW